MNPKYFCCVFRATTCRTPFDCLNHFVRQFRKYKGITPERYQATLNPTAREAAPHRKLLNGTTAAQASGHIIASTLLYSEGGVRQVGPPPAC